MKEKDIGEKDNNENYERGEEQDRQSEPQTYKHTYRRTDEDREKILGHMNE